MDLRRVVFITGLVVIGGGAYGLLTQGPAANTINSFLTLGGFTISFIQVFFGFPLLGFRQSLVQPVSPPLQPKPVPQRQGRYYGSGIGLILGSFLLFLSSIFLLIVNSPALFIAAVVTQLAAGIFYPLALPGMHKKQVKRAGKISEIGLVIVIISWLITDLLLLILLISFNRMLAGEPLPPSYFVISSLYPFLLLLPGNVLLGIAIIRASVFPKWIAMVFIAVAVIGLVGAFRPSDNVISTIGILSNMFLAAAYVRCGYILFTG